MKHWKKLSVFNVNSIERYASGFPVAEDGSYKTVSLNGEWDFKFLENPTLIPDGYEKVGAKLDGFQKITVPSNWQLKGYDTPIYTNYIYPYSLVQFNPLMIPHVKTKKNPVGLYVTEFEITDRDDDVFLNFGGIDSAGDIFVNGQFVGYSEDAFDNQEYDITDFIKIGKNKLAVTVYRFTTGTYLEDQDMWRLAGIFRDVNLVFKPKAQIADYFARSELNKDYSAARFLLDLKLSTSDKALETATVRTTLSFDGKKVFELSEKIEGLGANGVICVSMATEVEKIKLWSHEFPNLYDLKIELIEGTKVIDTRIGKFGFREIRIAPMRGDRGPFILLNGKPLKICGVNRHEFHPEYGHAVPANLIEEDIKLCKRNNIFAIRNSHYPNQDVFYDLCDKYGILVMAETNLETHGLAMFIPKGSKRWKEQSVYRARNMVNRLKNHVSIISWSLGNEAGFGDNFFHMKEAILNIDKTRFIHYEPDQTGKCGDVLSEMYSKLEKMPVIGRNEPMTHCAALWSPSGSRYTSEMYKDLPFIECEYAHCMGNALGNFADYWREFKKYDRLAGGFIWDFADQAIKRVRNGKTEWCYGGDFGDKPNAGRFAFNGIVRADRSPNPALYEVRKAHQQVDFTLDNGKLKILNRFMFTNLKDFVLSFNYLVDGVEFHKEENVVSVAPCTSVELPLPVVDVPKEGEIAVTVRLMQKNANAYSEKGEIIAYEQFVLRDYDYSKNVLSASGAEYVDNGEQITVKASDTVYIIDKTSGKITSVVKDGKEKLSAPFMPNFYRAVIDNDATPQVDIPIAKLVMGTYRFKNAARRIKAKRVEAGAENGIVTVTIDWKLLHMRNLKTVYRFDGDGKMEAEMSLVSNVDLIRYGFTFRLNSGIDGVKMYAKGPFENYCDRADAAILGRYEGKAEDFIHDYLVPQENGNRTGVREATVGGEFGVTLKAVDKPFEMSVHPYTTEMLDRATHLHELEREDKITVCVDGKQRGVGGDVPAIASLKTPYKILKNEKHGFKVQLQF